MRDPYDPTFFRNDSGPTLPAANFIDTSGYGVVPFRVRAPHGEPPQGEPQPARAEAGEPRTTAPVAPLDALRATIDAIAHEARWRGPPRDLPLNERVAGSRTVAKLNAAIAEIATLLAADPPSERRRIHVAPVPTGVLVTLADLKPALAMAARALRWLEERRHWQSVRASWGEH